MTDDREVKHSSPFVRRVRWVVTCCRCRVAVYVYIAELGDALAHVYTNIEGLVAKVRLPLIAALSHVWPFTSPSFFIDASILSRYRGEATRELIEGFPVRRNDDRCVIAPPP